MSDELLLDGFGPSAALQVHREPTTAEKVASAAAVAGGLLFLACFLSPAPDGLAVWSGLGAVLAAVGVIGWARALGAPRVPVLAATLIFVGATLAGSFGGAWWLRQGAGLAVIGTLGVGGSLAAIGLRYRGTTPGIRHDGLMFQGLQARGLVAWLAGVLATSFYLLLYLFPEGGTHPLEGGIRLVDPISWALRGEASDKWFLYGTLYTVAVAVMGLRMAMKYRHSRYHLVRTASVVFFQLGFAWILPGVLRRLQQPEHYFTYFWPLKYDALFPSSIESLLAHGQVGWFMVGWSLAASFVAVPVLTYFYGKRWYCSWVCGCGGLAETLGDPWRQLSDKSERAWRIERWSIHGVLVLIVLTTSLVWLDALWPGGLVGGAAGWLKWFYGLMIGAIFSGVIGVGFYPLFGSRVWCRFGCPQAAILGILQRFFSRFRITTNGGQCISCGNCSTYCEMGIDVRAYAQRGENIVRASCVGCGVCAAVCPRGVLKLENGPTHTDRFDGADDPVGEFLRAVEWAPRPTSPVPLTLQRLPPEGVEGR
jgi:ferredoxin-type protein NapH